MNLNQIAHNIEKADNGIYSSKTSSAISYPKEGNENFMQVEQNSFWFNHRNDVIAACVKKYSCEKVFFDIGGGNGFVAKRLQDEGQKVVLVEPGPSGAVNAKGRGVQNVICSTLEDAGFEHSTIDAAGMFDVVEHIEDDVKFMKDIHHYLKDDGYVYITVPAYNKLWSKEDNDAGHYRRYTLRQLNQLLEKTGYSVFYSTYLFSILPLPIFLFRSLPSKLGFNKNSNDLEKHKKEHSHRKGFLSNMLGKILDWELKRVRNRKKIPFGSSCFAVAKVNKEKSY